MSLDAERSGFVIGIDIGGTCTDVVMIDTTTHEQVFYKTETTPKDIETGVINGVDGILALRGWRPEDCVSFIHGTTLALNAVLTRSGARLGLLVTEGFADLLEIGRLQMPDPFNFYTQKREPLVRKRFVAEIPERILGNGEIDRPLEEEPVAAAVGRLLDLGAEIVVVCFINAYKNPGHERKAAEIIRRRFPGLEVSLSSHVWPEIREYERAMAAVLNAYVAPKVSSYLALLESRLGEFGIRVPLNITTSNGGMLPARLVQKRPGTTLFSGPAAGVIASARLAAACGIDNLVAFDMGGTSTDLAVIQRAQIPYSTEGRIGDIPIVFPSVDVVSVGAGGGSIARLDSLGILKVGPESAGADPGPVCYGRGGERPTVTDAYLATGILDPGSFLGGRVKLRSELTEQAFAQLARQTRYAPNELAEGVLRVATSNLMVGVGKVEANKGIDIRDFALLAYGGAGPSHACLLADELGIGHIVVPLSPGTFCAWGALLAEFRIDSVQTFQQPAATLDWTAVNDWFARQQQQARELLERETPLLEGVTALRSADMRYQGQGFNVEVTLADAILESRDSAALAEAFHRRYDDIYGASDRSVAVDFINARLTVVGMTPKGALRRLPSRGTGPALPYRERGVYFGGRVHRIPAYLRRDFGDGMTIEGPCVVDQDDSTVFLRPGWRGRVDEYGNLHLNRQRS